MYFTFHNSEVLEIAIFKMKIDLFIAFIFLKQDLPVLIKTASNCWAQMILSFPLLWACLWLFLL